MPIALKQKITTPKEFTNANDIKDYILSVAKETSEAGRHDELVVEFPIGRSSFTQTLDLSAKENPELLSLDITLRGKIRDMSEVSSLVRLEGTRFIRAEGTPYFTYQMDKDENGEYPRFHNVFFNFNEAKRQTTRVWKNPVSFTPEEQEGKAELAGIYAPIDIAKALAEGPIGACELVFYLEWEFASLHVTGVDLSNTLTEEGEEFALLLIDREELNYFVTNNKNNRRTKGRELYLCNCPALLSEDNSYAYDAKAGILYFDPKDKVNMRYHAIEIPTLEVLFRFEEMQNVTVENLTLRGVSSGYVCDHLYYTGQANNVKGTGRLRTAAILTEGKSESLTVKNCLFKEIGANGIQVTDYSTRTTVKDCIFKSIGMCAVSIGNPTWNWQIEINRTFTVRVENNYFEHIGYDYPSSPCLYIGQVDGLKILHNTICDCSYSAISVGWNWNPVKYELGEKINIRDAEIAYNYFRNYMQLLKDGGAIYVLGSNCNKDSRSDRFNLMHDNFAMVDTLSLVYGKYGYYCDGSASNWNVYHSVVINTSGMPIFSQPHPNASSYHNSFTDIYSNTQRHVSTHVPSRDVITTDYHLNEGDAEALLAAYPEAVKIRDAAGCDLVV